MRYSCKAGLRDLKFASLENERSDSQLPGLSANGKGISLEGLADDISGHRAENENESY